MVTVVEVVSLTSSVLVGAVNVTIDVTTVSVSRTVVVHLSGPVSRLNLCNPVNVALPGP